MKDGFPGSQILIVPDTPPVVPPVVPPMANADPATARYDNVDAAIAVTFFMCIYLCNIILICLSRG